MWRCGTLCLSIDERRMGQLTEAPRVARLWSSVTRGRGRGGDWLAVLGLREKWPLGLRVR
jgi:hypothetical protein